MTDMTKLRSQLPAGNGFPQVGGPRLCRYRRRMPERSAGQCACSHTLNCGVSFQRPRRSVLWSVLWDPAGGPVRVKTRSEERRVGKECRTRWATYYCKKKHGAVINLRIAEWLKEKRFPWYIVGVCDRARDYVGE